MTLRDVTWRDIDRLVALDEAIFRENAWNAASWWNELAQRPRREYVLDPGDAAPSRGPGGTAGPGDEVAGYGGLDHGGEVSDIMTIAVHPDARGRGLGRALLEDLLRRSADRGAGHVMLEVRADNAPARTLYEQRGFTVVRTRRAYYPAGGDALVMRLPLRRSTHG